MEKISLLFFGQKVFIFLVLLTLISCMSEDIKKEMDEAMQEGQEMFADQEFKKALAHIELYKIRNGKYPTSLRDLEFLTVMDSSMFNFVEYIALDSVYELNINYSFPSMSGNTNARVELKYPEKFWIGLGCIKSNAK